MSWRCSRRSGGDADDPVVRGGLRYLAREQRATGLLVRALGRQPRLRHLVRHLARSPRSAAAARSARRAVGWLLRRRTADGGWGETCHSYEDESFAGVGVSTASQTAWAVMALQRSGHGEHPPAGAASLPPRAPAAAGTWPEPEYTGTGFPGDFYLNYGMYRHLFPTMALAMAGGSAHPVSCAGPGVGGGRRTSPRRTGERTAAPSTLSQWGEDGAGPPSESPAPTRTGRTEPWPYRSARP